MPTIEERLDKLEQIFLLGGIGAPGSTEADDRLNRLNHLMGTLLSNERIGALLIGTLQIGTVEIEDDAITAPKIVAGAITVGDLAAGTLTVAATLGTGGSLESAASGARIQIDEDEIAGYDSGNNKQFYIRASDGKGVFGGGDATIDDSGLHFSDTSYGDGIFWEGLTKKSKLEGLTHATDALLRITAEGTVDAVAIWDSESGFVEFNKGVRLWALTSDPSVSAGSMWYRSDQGEIRVEIGVTTYSLDMTAV